MTSLLFQVIGTVAGITGALMMVWKKRGGWIAFSVSNISFVTMFLLEGIYVPIAQYAVFMSINIVGWIKWTGDLRGGRKQ